MAKRKPYNWRITTLDKYIIRKFMGTYFFAILIIIGIVIIFDISEKIDDFVDKEAPLRAIVVDYYMNFIPYFMNMFSPLFVFISVIFFTSKLASHSEIIAMLSGGISFNRIMYPYILSALFIALLSLTLNWFVIPPANRVRLQFEEQYLKKRTEYNRDIHYQVEPDTYVYMESYNSWNNTAIRFTLESFEGNQLISKLSAETARWDSTMGRWRLQEYHLRNFSDTTHTVTWGKQLDTLVGITGEDLVRRKESVEQLNLRQLNRFIETLHMRGDANIKFALIQKNSRLAVPFSSFILTIMGVALSSRKRRGGIGLNIGIGIALSFSYILFLRFSEMFVHADVMSPGIALWIPNILYAVVAFVLYRLAPK
jgi:lipopolysaccharide export system permease protein